MNLNWLKNLPPLQRNLLGGALVVLVLVLVAYFGYLPKAQRVDSLKADLAQLGSEATIYRAKVKKLDALLSENERLQRRLAEQRRQLPEQREVADLLRQVSDAGARSGLVFRLWRPETPAPSPSGLYLELPVQVEVSGSYHQVGVFFEKVAHLDRIVNITDLRMAPDAGGGLVATFTATAFAALPPELAEGTEDGKTAKKGTS